MSETPSARPDQTLGVQICLLAVVRCTREFLLVLDPNLAILALSQKVEELLGYEADDLVGQQVSKFLQNPQTLETLIKDLSREDTVAASLGFLNPDGAQVELEFCLSTSRDQQDRTVGYVLLGSRGSAWDEVQEELVRVDRLAEMGRLSAGIVHDLKNPLSVINQAAGWGGVVVEDASSLSDEDRSELAKTFKEIEEQTARCRTITNQVLDFVREAKPESRAFDLRTLLEETIRYLQPELKYPPITVETRFAPEPVMVVSDFRLLQQVFVNLLSNAIYAIREKTTTEGRIEVTIQLRTSSQARVELTDNGQGIPEPQQDRIFDLFYTTKPVGKGTGLGLPICRSIVHRLGGELGFVSHPGEGTTFWVSLPLSEQDQACSA